jgi:hypothetical protein
VSLAQRLVGNFVPGTVLSVLLNFVFLRTTSQKCQALLESIQETFGEELRLYDIGVYPEMLP